MTYVVDASVASRFILIEDLSDKAEMVLEGFLEGKFDLRAPELIVYEVGNVMWKAVEDGLINPDEAMHEFSVFLGLKINSIKLDEKDIMQVLDWSAKNNITYYDGVYVVSSNKVGATLLTADNVLFDKARKEVSTIHLKDFGK
ncbi:MAG: type II toxin-antitoxin system VapC family toxin [Candidatus Bathyarchaeia archaeon]